MRTEDIFKELVGRKHSYFAPINICQINVLRKNALFIRGCLNVTEALLAGSQATVQSN